MLPASGIARTVHRPPVIRIAAPRPPWRGSPVSSRVLRLEMTSGQPTLTIWTTVLPGWQWARAAWPSDPSDRGV
jgi:hypothetical protein